MLAIFDKDIINFLKSGLLGYYNQIEVTEVFTINSNNQVFNVYTLIVAEYKKIPENHKTKYLTKKLIHIKGLNEFAFGVKQYTLKLKNVLKLLEGDDKLTSRILPKLKLFSRLEYNKSKFVPSDSTETVPINKILKNNFFSGSYIFEWHDDVKAELMPLLGNPKYLLQLSDKITKECLTIKLASMTDRLGNIIFQIPINAVSFSFNYLREKNVFQLKCEWNSKIKPRKLAFVYDASYDGIILDKLTFETINPIEYIPVRHNYGSYVVTLIDKTTGFIIASSAKTSLLTEINTTVSIQEPEKRFFNVVKNGHLFKEKIICISHPSDMKIGKSIISEWTRKRKYNQEKEEASNKNTFVEFRPDKSTIKASNDVAINIIRNLINKYGDKSIYILDPYLSADDIINSLFYCKHFGSVLRGITSLEEPKAIYCPFHSGYYPGRISDDITKTECLVEEYRDKLNNIDSNYYGLNFELRARRGNNGYSFHDRFIIFPETREGPLAWSLGTSVNDVGKKHHIIQQVSNGQMVVDSFDELWESLNKEECIIWKKR